MKGSRVAFALLLAASCAKPPRDEKLEEEVKTREAYGRATVYAADAGRMLNVASTSKVIFAEDFSQILYDPPDTFRAHAFRWMGKQGHVRLRNEGKPMKLVARGWIHEKMIKTWPVIDAYIDGAYVATSNAVEREHWNIETIVKPDLMQGREWVDLTLACNAIAFHWGEPPVLKVVVLYELSWTEAAP